MNLTNKTYRRNAVKCLKSLATRRNGRETMYRSPYVGVPVPRDGCIVAKGKTQYLTYGCKVDKDEATVISGGAVHATTYSPGVAGSQYSQERTYVAYAFGVKAYGYDRDLAASFIYVPAADKSPNAAARRKVVEGWAKRKKEPNWTEINLLFKDRKPHPERINY